MMGVHGRWGKRRFLVRSLIILLPSPPSFAPILEKSLLLYDVCDRTDVVVGGGENENAHNDDDDDMREANDDHD